VKRTRLKPRSAKKIAADKLKPAIRESLYRRDGGRCALAVTRHDGVPPCFGRWTPHHLRKDGQGGEYNLVNLATLCAGHNDWVESGSPNLAHRLGLVCRNGDTLDECWERMRANGLVAR
jgi:hypothetical protein